MTPDMINGSFEFAAGGFILNHCRVMIKSGESRGTSALSIVFFFTWGIWNLYYYPHLDQMWSFLGGLFVVGANSLYALLIWLLRRST